MIRFIGDAHGKTDEYLEIAKESSHSIQLGDFGFSRSWNALYYGGLDAEKHKVLGGNHDDYDICINSPYYLGDFGEFTMDGKSILFIRGGLSIDRTYRVGDELSGSKKTWWSQEELSFSQMIDCLEFAKTTRPDIIISHAAPAMLIPQLTKGDLTKWKFHSGYVENTSLLLQKIVDANICPKMWLFGHYHVSFADEIGGVLYMGLPELGTIDVHNLH